LKSIQETKTKTSYRKVKKLSEQEGLNVWKWRRPEGKWKWK